MTLDKEEHRQVLLEMLAKAVFQGASVDLVKEIKDALVNAGVVDKPDGQ